MLFLDDIFSELDRERTRRLQEMAARLHQVFIATARPDDVAGWRPAGLQALAGGGRGLHGNPGGTGRRLTRRPTPPFTTAQGATGMAARREKTGPVPVSRILEGMLRESGLQDRLQGRAALLGWREIVGERDRRPLARGRPASTAC